MVLVYLLLAGLSAPIEPDTVRVAERTVLAFLSYVAAGGGVYVDVDAGTGVASGAAFSRRWWTRLSEHELTPSLRPAYRAARAGEFREALRLARLVMVTDVRHYEASLLVARVQRQLGRDWRARLTLHRALRNPRLMDAQRKRILGMLQGTGCGCVRRVGCWLGKRGG